MTSMAQKRQADSSGTLRAGPDNGWSCSHPSIISKTWPWTWRGKQRLPGRQTVLRPGIWPKIELIGFRAWDPEKLEENPPVMIVPADGTLQADVCWFMGPHLNIITSIIHYCY